MYRGCCYNTRTRRGWFFFLHSWDWSIFLLCRWLESTPLCPPQALDTEITDAMLLSLWFIYMRFQITTLHRWSIGIRGGLFEWREEQHSVLLRRSTCFVGVIHSNSPMVFNFLPPRRLHLRLNWRVLFWLDTNGTKGDHFFRNVIIRSWRESRAARCTSDMMCNSFQEGRLFTSFQDSTRGFFMWRPCEVEGGDWVVPAWTHLPVYIAAEAASVVWTRFGILWHL